MRKHGQAFPRRLGVKDFVGRILRGILIIAGGFVLPAAAAPAGSWGKIVAPRFTLYSSAKDTEALQAAEEFQQFIDSLGEILVVDTRRLPPLTIVMFSQGRDFKAFRPRRPDGKPWDVAGFFSRQDGWAVFGLAGARLDADTRRTVFHEGVHWYLSGSELPNPPWLEEGLAEVFSTFAVTKNRREWGQPIVDHVDTLRSSKPMPLERLLSVSHSDPLFNETRRTGLFYAESWAFVHLLLFGEHNRERTLYNDYVRLFRSGIHPDSAFKIAFKKDYQEMDRELTRYIEGGRYFVGGRVITPAVKALVVAPVNDSEKEIALGRLALGANRIPLAQSHLDNAFAAGGDSVALSEVKGYAALMDHDEVQATRWFRDAAGKGSKDYRVYFELAQRKHRAASDAGAATALSPGEAREVADNYEKTIELSPWLLAPYQGLGGMIGFLGKDGESDRLILSRGRDRFPRDGMIQVGLASSLHESGRIKEAGEALSVVLADPEKYPTTVTRYARDLERTWTFNEDCERIRILVDNEQFPEALKAIDVLLAQDVPQSSRVSLVFNRTVIGARVKLSVAIHAGEAGRWTEARKLLEEVLASAAPSGIKREAKIRLDEMDRQDLGRD